MMSAFPYDAIETDEAVCIVAVCPAPPGRPVESRIVDGRGLEITCGRWTLRASNLHPMLELACRTKPVSVAAIDTAGLVLRGPGGIEPALWRNPAFYWYLDPNPTTTEALARRPFPRAVALGGRAVIVSALGSASYGPPIGLCASSPAIAVLPPSRVWHRVGSGLLVDESILKMDPSSETLREDVAGSVDAVVPRRTRHDGPTRSTWRPQLALLASPA